MKPLSKFFLFIFLHLSLLSCVNKDPLAQFTARQTESIEPAQWIPLEDYGVLKPSDALRYGDDYIIIDNKRENIITRVNFSTNQFVSGINFGNGPNELNMIGKLRKVKDKLLLNDTSRQTIFEIITSQDSLLQLETYRKINYEKRLFFLDYLGDKVIAIGMYGDLWIGYIDLLTNELLSGVYFPDFDETSHLMGMQKAALYINTRIALSPDSKKLVAATLDAGVIISLIDVGEKELTEYKQIKYYPPEFKVVQGGNIAHSRTAKDGFCAIDCDDKYIYALYSGRTFNSHDALAYHCEHLFVYDWDGNPIKHYVLSIPMWMMRYDSEKNSIYGIAYDPEGGFIEYQL